MGWRSIALSHSLFYISICWWDKGKDGQDLTLKYDSSLRQSCSNPWCHAVNPSPKDYPQSFTPPGPHFQHSGSLPLVISGDRWISSSRDLWGQVVWCLSGEHWPALSFSVAPLAALPAAHSCNPGRPAPVTGTAASPGAGPCTPALPNGRQHSQSGRLADPGGLLPHPPSSLVGPRYDLEAQRMTSWGVYRISTEMRLEESYDYM